MSVRLGKGEDQLGVISIAMAGKTMRTNCRAEIINVQREEEGTQDGALRDPSSERTRIRHRSAPSYPVRAVVEVG